VAPLNSFTRAAQELHLSQPSLTKQLQHLEPPVFGGLFRGVTERQTLRQRAVFQKAIPRFDGKQVVKAFPRREIMAQFYQRDEGSILFR
jgi:hypothetical protein